MKRFRRPSLSDSRPKKRAPITSPIRYHQAMSLTAPADMFRVFLSVRSDPTFAAMVISRPSRIQATPSATISRVWNLDQGNRSIRAGIKLRIYGLLVVSEDVVAMLRSFSPALTSPRAMQGLFRSRYPRVLVYAESRRVTHGFHRG